jgi:signal transduction histidine kinase
MRRISRQRLPVGWLIALCLALGAIPLALLAYFSVTLSTDAVRHEAEARVEATATVSAYAVQNELEGFARLVQSYAQRPLLISAAAKGDLRGIRYQLRQLHRARPGIAAAEFARADGVLVGVVPPTPEIVGKDFSYRDWFQGALRNGGPYISESFVAQSRGRPRVIGASAVVPGRGRHIGDVLLAALSVRYLQHFVNRFAAAEGLRVTVADQRAAIVASPGQSSRGLVSARNDPLVAAALNGKTGTTQRDGAGGSVIAGYVPVRPFGWGVVAAVPTKAALARVDDLRSTVLTIATVLGIVILFGLALLARTVWQRTRAERELRAARERLSAQNEELRQLDRAKDEFLSLVTHELRTPLTSIIGYLELIEEGEAGELPPDAARFVKVIDRNAKRLLALVSDLLLVARIEAGRLELEPSRIELNELVAEAVEAARPTASERALDIELVADDGPVVEGDRQRLAEVIDNLVSNALKFTPSGGRIEVRVARDDGHARIDVADTGMGIPETEQERMFERFFRTSTATEHAIQGTGLGLAITKALVEAHQGEISFRSVEGEGTTFTIELPLAEDASLVAAAHGRREET